MARFSVDDVLMRLDEDTDDDFDGYLDEESYSRGSESDGGDDDNGGNVSDGHMSVESGNDSNSDGNMSVDGGNGNVSESDDGGSTLQQRD